MLDFTQTAYYTNRELSWLEFNQRVLDEARDKSIPLLDRLKFLSITASNLDEFFMVRVGSLTDMQNAGYNKEDIAGMKVGEQLSAIGERAHKLAESQYTTWQRSLLPALSKEGIAILSSYEDLNAAEKSYADKYFMDTVYPVLTPMAVDSSRPFPLVRNKSLNIGALLAPKEKPVEETGLNKGEEQAFATVQVPNVLPRFLRLPGKEGVRILLLETIIRNNLQRLFLNYTIISSGYYRITRNADLTIDEEEAVDLLQEIQKQLKKRQWGRAIRLEIDDTMDESLRKILKKELDVKSESIYQVGGPLDLTFLMKLYGLSEYDHLRELPYTPQPSPALDREKSIFANIREGDILLHHPYESFDPVVDFVRQAAVDPAVLAIKQTLYRVSGNSPIIAALAKAAENGKQVSVLVELKARFDEENNIQWAKMLEKSGCHVIYGLLGLKTHSKITLVVRMEEDGIRRYVHLGTGNYNDSTAKLYTDLGLLTCQPAIGEDATAVFNMLYGYSEPLIWNKLILAPLWLRDRMLYLIHRERDHALAGKPAFIQAKMNSLCDKEIIAALYEASAAGVQVDLVIRGICCLKVGIPGVSEHIRVRSIVGQFLEHSRIYYFHNDGMEEVYLASADLMPRNLDRRVEIMFPVEEPELADRVKEILRVELSDTRKAHILLADDQYDKVDGRGKMPLNSQAYFCEEAVKDAKKPAIGISGRTFTPLTSEDEESH